MMLGYLVVAESITRPDRDGFIQLPQDLPKNGRDHKA
jgi:hypothetical protein